jgi:hypothetical protein
LGEPVASLPFTTRRLGPFVASNTARQAMEEIAAMCR